MPNPPPKTNAECEPPAPTINGASLPPRFWANVAQNPGTLLGQNPTWSRAVAEINKAGTLMNSMRHMPLLWEPTVMYRGRRWKEKEHWPWTGKVFSGFISAKKSDYTGLLAQATRELLDGDNACWHCQQGMGMFYGDAPWDMAPLPLCQFSMVRYQGGTHQTLSSYSKDLRAMKDDVLANLISLRKLIERSGEHWQNADESNPEHADPPVPTVDMLTLTDIYHRELKGSWMRRHGKYLREILTTIGSVKDGVVELVNRLEALIANR